MGLRAIWIGDSTCSCFPLPQFLLTFDTCAPQQCPKSFWSPCKSTGTGDTVVIVIAYCQARIFLQLILNTTRVYQSHFYFFNLDSDPCALPHCRLQNWVMHIKFYQLFSWSCILYKKAQRKEVLFLPMKVNRKLILYNSLKGYFTFKNKIKCLCYNNFMASVIVNFDCKLDMI